MLEMIGLIGGIFFGAAAIPPAIKALRTGRSTGTPISIAWMILGGTIFTYTYLYLKNGFDWVITITYAIEFLSWMVVLVYHYKDKFTVNTVLNDNVTDISSKFKK